MKSLKKAFPDLEEHVSLAPFTTFKIGGTARYFYRATDTTKLPELLKTVKKLRMPYFILGGGSCVLLSSHPFPGLVILLKNSGVTVAGNVITAKAGTPWNQVIMVAYKNSLTGVEGLFGIPGTVGGAVAGNVGVPSLEIKDMLGTCTIINNFCELEVLSNKQCSFEYRNSRMKKRRELIIDATFVLEPGEQKTILEKMNAARAMRNQKHPHDPSAGSYFKNPFPDKPAGMLIDQCGGKGMCVGDACVSEKHANFLINKGHASSDDMLALGTKLKQMVKEKFGIKLQEEVHYISYNPVFAFLIENPITRYVVALFLILLGLTGLILPVLPGWIFIFMAIEIIAPLKGWGLLRWFFRSSRIEHIWRSWKK